MKKIACADVLKQYTYVTRKLLTKCHQIRKAFDKARHICYEYHVTGRASEPSHGAGSLSQGAGSFSGSGSLVSR